MNYNNIQEFNDSFFAYIKCYFANCKAEIKKVKKVKEEWEQSQFVLYINYKYGRITYEEFIEENYKIDDKYYKSLPHINLTKCKLDKCYDKTKKFLDEMLIRVNNPIREKYDVDEFIEITKMHREKSIYPSLKIKNIVNIDNNYKLLNECYLKNCEKELERLNKLRKNWINKSTVILNKYINNKINLREYKAAIKIIDDKYYNSLAFKKTAECKLSKCYELTKTHLDYLSDIIHYPTEKSYNIADYTKITRLNTNRELLSSIKKK
jgi:hypothetical protein